MKRFLALFLIVVLSFTMTVSARQVELPENWEGLPTVQGRCICEDHLNQTALLVPGDINRDGDINAADALLILQCATNPLSVYNRYKRAGACMARYVADLDGDENINAVDALYVLQYAVGKRDRFEVSLAIPDVTFYEPPNGFGPFSPTDV